MPTCDLKPCPPLDLVPTWYSAVPVRTCGCPIESSVITLCADHALAQYSLSWRECSICKCATHTYLTELTKL